VSGLPLLLPYTQGVVAMLQGRGALSADPTIATGWFYLLVSPLPMLAVLGTVAGHNYSLWMAVLKRRFSRTGKGLATGAGALIAYDWRYCLAALIVALLVIALTRYMLAGQVAAAFTLPITAILTGSFDWPFALFMGALIYMAHHRRFVGMLQGNEPRLYVNDRMGPRG
jgi:glycerol-3-phosphate acyltransferase PlsY